MKTIQQQHCAATSIIRIPSIHIRCAVIAEVDLLTCQMTMRKMMNTFGTAKTLTTEKLMLCSALAILTLQDKILIGVARMTQRPSNHAKCAAGVEVESHG